MTDNVLKDDYDIDKINGHDDHCMIKKISNKAVLYVISVISNPLTFDRRYELFNYYKERMEKEKNIKSYQCSRQSST